MQIYLVNYNYLSKVESFRKISIDTKLIIRGSTLPDHSSIQQWTNNRSLRGKYFCVYKIKIWTQIAEEIWQFNNNLTFTSSLIVHKIFDIHVHCSSFEIKSFLWFFKYYMYWLKTLILYIVAVSARFPKIDTCTMLTLYK